LTVSGISYPTGFSGTWSGTIASGKTTNVTVTFAPLDLTTYSGTVTVNSDKTSGGDTISASGTGTPVPVPTLTVTPLNRAVSSAAGTTTFAVTNTGDGAMSYTASETQSWLSITGGGSGGDSGVITISYDANSGTDSRTGTITVTASGANGSPANVTITQNAPLSFNHFDGDGASDLGIFDTAGGYWFIKSVSSQVVAWASQWGWSTAKPISGDFDGDGIYDLAVYDTSNNRWYIRSLDGRVIAWGAPWGFPGGLAPALGD
jgi:hypothetical protein